jgi:hypothetical protein
MKQSGHPMWIEIRSQTAAEQNDMQCRKGGEDKIAADVAIVQHTHEQLCRDGTARPSQTSQMKWMIRLLLVNQRTSESGAAGCIKDGG